VADHVGPGCRGRARSIREKLLPPVRGAIRGCSRRSE
jgi:hypothetical protein